MTCVGSASAVPPATGAPATTTAAVAAKATSKVAKAPARVVNAVSVGTGSPTPVHAPTLLHQYPRAGLHPTVAAASAPKHATSKHSGSPAPAGAGHHLSLIHI